MLIMTDARSRPFAQVNVFSTDPLGGNPVAVVLDGTGLSDAEMAAFARWTNLSETTFVLPPTDPGADYRLRIFTPATELPFAGHPTLGSAYAWLAGRPGPARVTLVQECGIGLVSLRVADGRIAFAAPPLQRSGPLDPDTLARAAAAVGFPVEQVVAHQWVVNGPDWLALYLPTAQAVRDLQPDWSAFGGLKVGVIGPESDGKIAYEVRAFCPDFGVPEDPVTGSLNAGLATWLRAESGSLRAPESYVVAQGTALGRTGRIHVDDDGEQVWIGGDCTTVIDGTV